MPNRFLSIAEIMRQLLSHCQVSYSFEHRASSSHPEGAQVRIWLARSSCAQCDGRHCQARSTPQVSHLKKSDRARPFSSRFRAGHRPPLVSPGAWPPRSRRRVSRLSAFWIPRLSCFFFQKFLVSASPPTGSRRPAPLHVERFEGETVGTRAHGAHPRPGTLTTGVTTPRSPGWRPDFVPTGCGGAGAWASAPQGFEHGRAEDRTAALSRPRGHVAWPRRWKAARQVGTTYASGA